MIKLLNHNEISFIQTSGNPHLIADLVNSTRIAAAAGKPKAKCWRGKKNPPQIHPPTQEEMQGKGLLEKPLGTRWLFCGALL